jgi:hypothetical protein
MKMTSLILTRISDKVTFADRHWPVVRAREEQTRQQGGNNPWPN